MTRQFSERAARAGVSVKLEIWEGMQHVFQRDVAHLESSSASERTIAPATRPARASPSNAQWGASAFSHPLRLPWTVAVCTGSVAVITGDSRGIGFESALALGSCGAKVVLAGRDRSTLDAAVARLAESGISAVCALVDVTDPTARAYAHKGVGRGVSEDGRACERTGAGLCGNGHDPENARTAGAW